MTTFAKTAVSIKEKFFLIPGTDQVLVYQHDAENDQLQVIAGEGRVYWERNPNNSILFDGGQWELTENRIEKGFVRVYSGHAGKWKEHYLLDDKKRPVFIDGVDIIRDDCGRVVACMDRENKLSSNPHEWFYTYQPKGLVSIEGPGIRRQIALDDRGRVLGWRGDGLAHEFSYNALGAREDVKPLPAHTFHRDTLGRLWTIRDPQGRIKNIFLWEGYRCFARIDGPIGAPVSAVFSLDPTGTPIRVITPDAVTRVPRDAFGESLLHLEGVPGLFGALTHNGLAYLPWRVLDSKVGAFCSPDPYDGSAADPRRGPGGEWTGPLPVEPDGENRYYTVCRHDPIGRADPSGAISAGLIISDITWSLQNNILTFFGLDWTINFLASLFTGFQIGEFGSSEGLKASDRMGSFALRRDGVLVNSGTHAATGLRDSRAFTTQHIVWATANDFILLERGRVIDPKERFEPTLYGTLLLAQPKEQPPFVLVGGGGTGAAMDWSRYGGPAEPAAPGSLVPKFPRGGFHFNVINPVYSSNIDCPLTELVPGADVTLGTLQSRAVINLPLSATAPSAGDLVLLTDTQNDLVLTKVASSTLDSGRRLIRLDDDAPSIGPNNVTLRQMDPAPVTSETRAAEAAVTNAFTAVGATHPYSKNDLLNFKDNGTGDITVARVEKLEARLPLDRALPNTFTKPIQISSTLINGTVEKPKRTGNDTLEFAAGKAPAVGSLGLVSGNGQAIPVRVTSSPSADTVQVDTNVSTASALNDPVDFQSLVALNSIGQRDDAPEGASQITYAPSASGQAPDGSASTVVLRFDSSGNVAVRRVTAAPGYDAVAMDRAITGPGPWTVERYKTKDGSSDITGLTITQAASLVARPSNIVDNASALRLQLVSHSGTPPVLTAASTLYSNQTINGDKFTASAPPSGAGRHPANPQPGEVVLGTDANGSKPLLVHKVRLTPTFDRNLDVNEDNLTAVRLGTDGFVWTATRVANDILTLGTQVAGVDMQFPRFQTGEIVLVNWTDSGAQSSAYRVSKVQGLTLTLEGGTAVITAAASAITVQRLVPTDPGTGDSLLAREGKRVGASPSNQITFSVWQPNAFPDTRVVGIISGDKTFPAVVTNANQDCEITFSANPGMTNPVDIGSLNPSATGFATRFVREGDTILVTDDTTGLSTGANQELLVVPFVTSDVAAKSARLHPGSLLVPVDESTEIDRRQSLIDHELAHTIQYSKWGPLWFCLFPTFILELGLELGTDTDLPNYSEFQAGTVTAEGTNYKLKFTGASLSLSKNDVVQLVQGGSVKTAKVDDTGGGEFTLKPEKGSAPLFTGNLQARKRNQNLAADVFMNIFQTTTHGGLVNITAGSLWSSVIWLISKGVYGLHRARIGTGELYPATVKADGMELELTDDKGKQEVKAGRVSIKSENNVVVRSATKSGNVLTLDQKITFTGTVNVANYSTHDPGSAFDWVDYYAANVITKDNPFVVKLSQSNASGMEAGIRDRVEIKYRDQSFRTNVVSVNGDDIGLEDPIPIANSELSLRIGRIGTRDPMGNADSIVMESLGLGWMRWIFDPWGQIQVQAQPKDTWLSVFLHAVRYVMGTQNWSVLAPPFFGYVFWWRLFRESESHLTAIEQNASEESGDLYSPLGRLYGQRRKTGAYGHYNMVVGDVARYYYWPHSSEDNFVTLTNQSSPGVHVDKDEIRIIPFPDNSGASGEPNATTQVDPAETNPALGISDLFMDKNLTAPNQLIASVTGPTSMEFSERGLIPTAATTQRHLGGYAAFTRPGEYRATTRNGITGGDRGREAHEDEAQTLFFNITVVDVTVKVNGIEVSEGATVDLIQTQQATVSIEVPADERGGSPRQFRTTLPRPEDGPVLRQSNNRVLSAQTTNGSERVEVSRFYDFDEDKSTYTDECFSRFGVHLGGDIHITVRQFVANVVDTLPLRGDANPTSAAADLKQGQKGFLLIPSAVVDPPELKQFDGRAPANTDPKITISPIASPSDAVKAFIGSQGAAFEVSFDAAPAVAGSTPIRLEVKVGSGTTATLSCTFNLVP